MNIQQEHCEPGHTHGALCLWPPAGRSLFVGWVVCKLGRQTSGGVMARHAVALRNSFTMADLPGAVCCGICVVLAEKMSSINTSSLSFSGVSTTCVLLESSCINLPPASVNSGQVGVPAGKLTGEFGSLFKQKKL